MSASDAEPLKEHLYFDLTCAPSARLLPALRRFALETCLRGAIGADRAYRISLGAHELLENAITYTSKREVKFRIELLPNSAEPTVRLQVSNESTPQNLARLGQFFEEMQSFPDPKLQYQHLMQRVVTQKETAGLGLGRVRAEAHMTIWHEVKGLEVTVFAQTPKLGARP
jgi:hypothetical protein